jgi:hypothetical protein
MGLITQKISNLEPQDILNRAKSFIFSTGINDGAAKLCRANMKYALAMFHIIQERYGFEPKATFISSPDETVSRNSYRWNSGFGYGGKLIWGNGNEKIIFLNVKPNCCGILVGGLEELPEVYEIIKKIDEIKGSELYYNDIPLNWDYDVSNHFINCFETKNLSNIELPPYIFFIHGSAPEFIDEKYGMGLYVDKSKLLKELAIEESTKFGKQYLLIDNDASDFIEFNKKAIEFSKNKRKIIANNIFGNNYKVICNQTHQFLKDYNNMYLGSNCTNTNCNFIDSDIFPTALRADVPAYLFKGKDNFTETVMQNLNFLERAEILGVKKILESANILPHGGGYRFPDIKKVNKVLEYKDQRYFVCELKTKERVKIIRNVREIQYEYRGRDIVLKTLQLDLGSIIARLNPIFSLKL